MKLLNLSGFALYMGNARKIYVPVTAIASIIVETDECREQVTRISLLNGEEIALAGDQSKPITYQLTGQEL